MIRICEISNGGYTGPRWLCDRCAKARKPAWSVKSGAPIAGPCDDCIAREQASPGYVTPTVDASPTSPGARLPSKQECPPPRAIPPWAKPGQARQRTVSEEVRR